MPYATFVHDCDTVSYIPETNVESGDIISVDGFLGIAHVAIPANTVGALRTHGVYDIQKTADTSTGHKFTLGAPVYWDTTNHLAVAASGVNIIQLGVCVEPAAKTDGYVRVYQTHMRL